MEGDCGRQCRREEMPSSAHQKMKDLEPTSLRGGEKETRGKDKRERTRRTRTRRYN